jgi:hypothetical protein
MHKVEGTGQNMSYMELIGISVLSSGIASGLILVVARKMIERSIDHLFSKKEAELQAKMGAKMEASGAMFSKELTIYQEVMELVYRCRNAARDLVSKEKNYDPENIQVFNLCSKYLTENLYKYMVFFSDDIFQKLHSYKNITQDINVLINQRSRPKISQYQSDSLTDELAKKQLQEKYQELDMLFNNLKQEIDAYLHNKTLYGKQ